MIVFIFKKKYIDNNTFILKLIIQIVCLPKNTHKLGCETANFNFNALWKLSILLLVRRGKPM